MCSRFATSSPHRTQMSPTWKAEWACQTPPKASFRYASHFRSIEPDTMKRFDNPGFDMGRESKATNSSHGLFKGANTLLLHRIPPARPL
eukprot:1074011-Amphidinium_carterae.1